MKMEDRASIMASHRGRLDEGSRGRGWAKPSGSAACLAASIFVPIRRTGVVSENMQGLGAKLRKLASQAKICTPPGGEVIAKICVLRSKDLYSRIETGRALPRVRQHEVRQSHIGGLLNSPSACDLSDCGLFY